MKINWDNVLKVSCALLAFLALIITIGSFTAICNTYYIDFDTKLDEDSIGNIGSFLSGLTTVFWSILSSVLVFYALFRQTKEFKKQQSTIEKQNFEGTFFNMLNTLSQIVSSIQQENNTGRVYIKTIIKELKNEYEKNKGDRIIEIELKVIENQALTHIEREDFTNYIAEVYESIYEGNQHLLSHYLRYIYNLMQFVIRERKEIDDEYYINLIQAQLSDVELSLIFHNALSTYGMNSSKRYHFFDLLEEYQFLENIHDNSLVHFSSHALYKKTIFKFLNNDQKALKKECQKTTKPKTIPFKTKKAHPT